MTLHVEGLHNVDSSMYGCLMHVVLVYMVTDTV